MNKSMGVFWIPSEKVRNAELVEGVLEHSSEGTILEIDSDWLHSAFALESTIKCAWRRRVVGKLGDGVFVSMEECKHINTIHCSMRSKTRMKFKVSGNVFLSNDENIVSPDEVNAHEIYVEIVGLPEWFASALSHSLPSTPYATGIPRTRETQIEVACNDGDFEIRLDADFHLHIQNTLYWKSDGLFDLNVRQATIARVRATGLNKADLMLDKIRPLVNLVRFLSGENCVIRSAYLYRKDRFLPDKYGGGPSGVQLLTSESGHRFAGWGDMLFRWRDIAGHENTVIRNWYQLCSEKRNALRLLDRVVCQGESAEGGIVLIAGAMEKLSPCKNTERYEKFLRDLGLESWDINVAVMGERISDFRNTSAHGRQLPTDENFASIYRFAVAAMRVYFLREMGFTKSQVLRIAKRHRGVREGLGLPQEDLDANAYNEMLQPGWIMEGRTVGSGTCDEI